MRAIPATLITALQLCWWTLSVSAATIYGTAETFGAQGPATLYTIDSTTGATTRWVSPDLIALVQSILIRLTELSTESERTQSLAVSI